MLPRFNLQEKWRDKNSSSLYIVCFYFDFCIAKYALCSFFFLFLMLCISLHMPLYTIAYSARDLLYNRMSSWFEYNGNRCTQLAFKSNRCRSIKGFSSVLIDGIDMIVRRKWLLRNKNICLHFLHYYVSSVLIPRFIVVKKKKKSTLHCFFRVNSTLCWSSQYGLFDFC